MPGIEGGALREWRRTRGWDVPEMARQLRRAARGRVAAHDGLIRMIYAWERGDHAISERYELLYRKLGLGTLGDVPRSGMQRECGVMTSSGWPVPPPSGSSPAGSGPAGDL
jgi:hypothetical protein